MKRETSITLTLVIILLAGGFFIRQKFSSHKTNINRTDKEKIEVSYRTVRVKHKSLNNQYQSYGSVVALKTIQLNSLTTGKIIHTHDNFIEGGLIHKGEIILSVDTVKLKIHEKKLLNELSAKKIQEEKIKQNASNLLDSISIAKANLQISQNELNRSKVMLSEKTISAQSNEAALLKFQNQKATLTQLENQQKLLPHDLDSIQNQVEAILLQLQETRVDINRSSIKAPFTLRITNTHVNLGQFVAPNTPLAEAYDAQRLDLAIEVPSSQTSWLIETQNKSIADVDEANFNSLKLPQNTIEWISPQVTGKFRAKNVRLSSAFDTQTRNLKLFMELEPKLLLNSPLILPGSFAKVTLEGKQLKNVVSIPTMSIYDNQVQVVRDGKVSKKSVEIVKSNGTDTFVKNTFSLKDEILLRFRETLEDGSSVLSVPQE
ncbi:MAG: HlyD family efflux transporter periplasmic adaptor subunit [Candidatus Cloacimonetes bacterium]|nr:HlyD family efflux transporter periplasmic adaptor subunit [Candidatus Cloacimonadota bacterium]